MKFIQNIQVRGIKNEHISNRFKLPKVSSIFIEQLLCVRNQSPIKIKRDCKNPSIIRMRRQESLLQIQGTQRVRSRLSQRQVHQESWSLRAKSFKQWITVSPAVINGVIKANQVDFCFYFGYRKLQGNVVLTVMMRMSWVIYRIILILSPLEALKET